MAGGRYLTLWRHPGARAPMLVGILARLPFGMSTLSLLLLVQSRTGSFAAAGLVSGCYSGALAVAAPVRGRSVDRRGARRVLRTSGLVYPLALGATLLAALVDARPAVVAAVAALAGASLPPAGPLVRSLWSVLFDDEADRTAAYALDAVLIEVSFVSSPLVVGAIIALASPAAAVGAAGLCAAAGALLLAATPAVGRLEGHGGVRRSLTGPLSEPAVRWLLAAVLSVGAAFGATELSVASFAAVHGSTALAGPLLAVWSAGSALGGLGYGARTWSTPAAQQYPRLLGLLFAGLALPLLATRPLQLGGLLLLGGAAIAPFLACNSVLLGQAAPTGATTEAFAWSSSALVLGLFVGSVVAGALVERVGPGAGFLVATCLGLLALGTGVARRLRRTAPVT